MVQSSYRSIYQSIATGAAALGIVLSAVCTTSIALAQDNLPGKGITVTPVKSSIVEETFQTLLLIRRCEV